MVGKGYKNSSKSIKDIIASIEPSSIPGEMLDSMVVQMCDHTKFKIDKRYLKDGLNYNNIEKQLSKFGITKDVDQIEIVIDLDLANRLISEGVEEIFSSYF